MQHAKTRLFRVTILSNKCVFRFYLFIYLFDIIHVFIPNQSKTVPISVNAIVLDYAKSLNREKSS